MTAAPSRIRFALLGFLLAATTVVAVAYQPVAANAGAVMCRSWEATIVGTPDADLLEGTPGRDVIAGLGGDDVIYGFGGNDIICGHGGNDLIYGNRGHDVIFGGYGDDDIRAGKGNDRVWGQAGEDVVYAGVHSDVCRAELEFNCELDYRGTRDKELWRDLVDKYFGDIGETDNAITIIGCESLGDPFAVNPNGSVPVGLWQFIPSTWEWASPLAGWEGEVRVHPEAATATARWLYDWADGRTRQDGSTGKGFDPWVHCRCLIPEYDCPFDASALEGQ